MNEPNAHAVARLMKYRQEADYNASYIFTEQDYLHFQNEGEHLCAKIQRYLQGKGYV